MVELVRRLTRWSPLWGGFLVSVAVVFFLGLILGLVLYCTPLPEHYLGSYVLAILTVGVFLGAFAAAQAAQTRGLFHGLLVALVFLLLVLGCTLFAPSTFSLAVFGRYALAVVVAGVLGGIVGVCWR
ncbi:MAG: TIGR04086 family membrane protein [Clostridia bacterium]|nr:TIGR04086 family membrane protein [Clostridia bacterium]